MGLASEPAGGVGKRNGRVPERQVAPENRCAGARPGEAPVRARRAGRRRAPAAKQACAHIAAGAAYVTD